MKTSEDPRHSARLIVLQKLFYDDFKKHSNSDLEEISIEDMVDMDEINDYSQEMVDQLFAGVIENAEKCDELIVKYAPQWPLEQIKRVDLQILRMALYEGFIAEITPPKVAIDEAIELGKEFGGNASDKFINGVLGAIYEDQRSKDSKKKKES